MIGTNANDQINGMAGNDVIDGGGGADTITGGLGFDTLTGGAGPDVFRYNSIAEAAVSQSGAKETITDFDYTQDALSFALVNGVFNFVGSSVGSFTGDQLIQRQCLTMQQIHLPLMLMVMARRTWRLL